MIDLINRMAVGLACGLAPAAFAFSYLAWRNSRRILAILRPVSNVSNPLGAMAAPRSMPATQTIDLKDFG